MAIEQLRVGGDNFSYLIYCEGTGKAAIVDPGMNASKALDIITGKYLELLFIINTHGHDDHTADNGRVKKAHPNARIIANEGAYDKNVEYDDEIMLGDVLMRFILTPGHTPGGICIIVDDKVIITGDTLFIGNCGRTDLPGGSDEQMFSSLKDKIGRLPDELIVYPGHDYGSKPADTLGGQKKENPTMAVKTLDEFLLIP
jgi:hydroxyacylglutathione hydrolase